MHTRHHGFPSTSQLWALVGLALLLLPAGKQVAAAPPPESAICGWYSIGAICSRYREWPPCTAVCGCPPGANAANAAQTRDQATTGSAGNNFSALSSCPTCSERPTLEVQGLASYWVSEPAISLRLEDEPLGYNPARGDRIPFHLSYRQRGAIPEDPTIFGLGPNWSCSFRAFLIDFGTFLRLHRGGAGGIDYAVGAMQYLDGSIASAITGGYQITYANGAIDVFTNAFTFNSYVHYFLTSHRDPAGNIIVFTYANTPEAVQLATVSDPDGNLTRLYYQNAAFTNQITVVVDPFSRTNILQYDESGYLTNIVDVVGLTSGFKYDAGTRRAWITNLVTKYGTTAFSFGGVDVDSDSFSSNVTTPNRWVKITLPTGGTELYVYRQNCTDFMAATYSPAPTIYVLGSGTLDNVDQNYRNSFRWDAWQCSFLSTSDPTALTSTDYSIGRLHHWLNDSSGTDPSQTLSVERLPSQDGSVPGQLTWYDYDGKTIGNNYVGTNEMPCLVAWVLPDGETRYTHYTRNTRGLIRQAISTYSGLDGSVGLRTNALYYGPNDIDLYQLVGPNGQVMSNYFATGNTTHLPDASYDALNQETTYQYNSYGQVTSIQRPTRLTTTNTYASSGNGLNRLQQSIDLEILRTNSSRIMPTDWFKPIPTNAASQPPATGTPCNASPGPVIPTGPPGPTSTRSST